MIITIDGPSGSGKSSVAKKIAETLHIVYCDTGAMYRAVTHQIIQKKIDFQNPVKLREFLDAFSLEIQLIQDKKHYFVNRQDITEAIRTQEVTALVSEVSAIPMIREHLVSIQRQVGSKADAVFDGRDQGTVVFPHAELKVFLSARPEVRAQRRLAELQAKDPVKYQSLTHYEIVEDLNRRDEYDSKRKHSPLKAAEDAHVIDTSDLSIDEVVAKILSLKAILRHLSE